MTEKLIIKKDYGVKDILRYLRHLVFLEKTQFLTENDDFDSFYIQNNDFTFSFKITRTCFRLDRAEKEQCVFPSGESLLSAVQKAFAYLKGGYCEKEANFILEIRRELRNLERYQELEEHMKTKHNLRDYFL